MMLKHRITAWLTKPGFIFGVLFLVSILAYGLLIPWLHLYIDDWIWVWTWEKMGRAGLVKYFSTNRPLWGLVFQITLPLLGQNVLAFHLFSFMIRWASALALWWLLSLLWPKRPEVALLSALFFLIFPGFTLQPIALTYGHLFLIYLFFLLSLCFHQLALRQPRYFVLCSTLAILLSMVNLLTMEYFFTLELIRPVLLSVLALEQEKTTLLKRVQWVFRQWLPYLLLFLGIGYWRASVYKIITVRYHLSFLDKMQVSPIESLLELGKVITISFWHVTFGAWLPALSRLGQLNWRLNNSLFTLVLIGITVGLVYLALLLFFRSNRHLNHTWKEQFYLIVPGLIILFCAGWPFWLTGLKILPTAFNSRFTLPFIGGSALLFTGLLCSIRPIQIRAAVAAVLVGIACGYHFQNANIYRLEWEQNRQLLWQIAWRIPEMEEGTTLFITDFPVTTYNIATLITEINILYPSVKQSSVLAYNILYDREQNELLPQGLVRDIPLKTDNVTAEFIGSTSQVLSAQYNLSKCFRLFDPELDSEDTSLAEYTRRAIQLSSWKWVKTDENPGLRSTQWFGSEPANQWCYYFEKAELARQMGDWSTAAQLGDEAQAKGFTSRDEMEKLVFIEAYAQTNQWDRAIEKSQSFQNPEKQPVLCDLWQRINQSTPASKEKELALQQLNQSGICPNFDGNR